MSPLLSVVGRTLKSLQMTKIGPIGIYLWCKFDETRRHDKVLCPWLVWVVPLHFNHSSIMDFVYKLFLIFCYPFLLWLSSGLSSLLFAHLETALKLKRQKRAVVFHFTNFNSISLWVPWQTLYDQGLLWNILLLLKRKLLYRDPCINWLHNTGIFLSITVAISSSFLLTLLGLSLHDLKASKT